MIVRIKVRTWTFSESEKMVYEWPGERPVVLDDNSALWEQLVSRAREIEVERDVWVELEVGSTSAAL